MRKRLKYEKWIWQVLSIFKYLSFISVLFKIISSKSNVFYFSLFFNQSWVFPHLLYVYHKCLSHMNYLLFYLLSTNNLLKFKLLVLIHEMKKFINKSKIIFPGRVSAVIRQSGLLTFELPIILPLKTRSDIWDLITAINGMKDKYSFA